MVERLAKFDLSRRLADVAPVWVIKSACALLGVSLAVILRLAVDAVAPGAAPFALIYPAALLATVTGGWEAGLATLFIAEVLAVFFLGRIVGVSVFTRVDFASMVLVALSGSAVVAVAQGFRLASRRVIAERTNKLSERDLLFRELRHRVANDFALVNSTLELQRRRSTDPETQEALLQVATRITNIAQAHRDLYDLADVRAVDLCRYLNNLTASLSEVALPGRSIALACACEGVHMDRDRAAALGIITNELVTNAVKYAFPDQHKGEIQVRFGRHGKGWRLTVADNGIGLPSPEKKRNGLGTGLVESFAARAGGVVSIESDRGTAIHIDLPADTVLPEPRTKKKDHARYAPREGPLGERAS